MKKVFYKVIWAMAVAVMLVFMNSCASLPKTIGEDDSLVIGKVKIYAHDYDYITVNGNDVYFKTEVTIKDTITGKLYTKYTDKEGFYYFLNLPVGHTFSVEKIMIQDNYGGSVWINQPGFYPFAPQREKVCNLGYVYLEFDGKNNRCNWHLIDSHSPKTDLWAMNEDSEWMKARVIDSTLLR